MCYSSRLLKLCIRIQTSRRILPAEGGQDLVEYALVAALISLAAIVGMKSVATALGVAYTNLGTKFASYTT